MLDKQVTRKLILSCIAYFLIGSQTSCSDIKLLSEHQIREKMTNFKANMNFVMDDTKSGICWQICFDYKNNKTHCTCTQTKSETSAFKEVVPLVAQDNCPRYYRQTNLLNI